MDRCNILFSLLPSIVSKLSNRICRFWFLWSSKPPFTSFLGVIWTTHIKDFTILDNAVEKSFDVILSTYAVKEGHPFMRSCIYFYSIKPPTPLHFAEAYVLPSQNHLPLPLSDWDHEWAALDLQLICSFQLFGEFGEFSKVKPSWSLWRTNSSLLKMSSLRVETWKHLHQNKNL